MVKNLGALVGGFKSGVSREGRRLELCSGRLWQPRFYEHVVRHERALDHIREYIVNNPMAWELDMENPERRAEHEFYRWLAAYARRTRPEAAEE